MEDHHPRAPGLMTVSSNNRQPVLVGQLHQHLHRTSTSLRTPSSSPRLASSEGHHQDHKPLPLRQMHRLLYHLLHTDNHHLLTVARSKAFLANRVSSHLEVGFSHRPSHHLPLRLPPVSLVHRRVPQHHPVPQPQQLQQVKHLVANSKGRISTISSSTISTISNTMVSNQQLVVPAIHLHLPHLLQQHHHHHLLSEQTELQ